MGTGLPQNEDETIPVVEESIVVDKTKTVTGKVIVRTATNIVTEIARESLESEAVDITHVPIGRKVDAVSAMRVEGNTTIIPVFEEVMVVEKQLILIEELHITRRVTSQIFEQPVELRKQQAVIERLDTRADISTEQEA